MTLSEFKQKLALVFDDDPETEVWHNVPDKVILSMIVLSSLEVFLSTFEGVARVMGSWLKTVEIATTLFFTVEVALRIWAADLSGPKYKGFRGRVRYCLSFYGLIDILSTYPFYLSLFVSLPMQTLKMLRAFRLLRIFRYMKSFRMLKDAFRSKKRELLVSSTFLVMLTIVLSFFLFTVENAAQPQVYQNGGDALIWAFAKYLGDPGKIADYPLITIGGNIIAGVIGVLGICIFAVPAGLMGSAFLEVMEQDKKKRQIKENILKIEQMFERRLDRLTHFYAVPLFWTLPDIRAQLRMSEAELMETLETSDQMRIKNLANTLPISQRPTDRLAVEYYPLNAHYGCCIDRQSKITIVAPSNDDEAFTGHFAYYLSKIGGFNYVSREVSAELPRRSFYLKPDNAVGFEEFMTDVERVSAGKNRWIITILGSGGRDEPEFPSHLHITYGGKKGNDSLEAPGLLVHDTATAHKIFCEWEKRLRQEFAYVADRQQYHTSDSPKVFIRHLANAAQVNGVILRCSWSMIGWDKRRLQIAQMIAQVLQEQIEPGKEPTPANLSELRTKGIAYQGYEH